jgi:hypothetical protein
MPIPPKFDVTKLTKQLAETPSRDDAHEQRETEQVMPGVVRRTTKPSITDVKKLDPVRPPNASTTNEDIERAEGEGMTGGPPPPRPEPKKKPHRKEKRHDH